MYLFISILFNLIYYSQSFQSGYTCETSIKITCPQSEKVSILEVIYSTECPNINETYDNSYAPSRCLGHFREKASSSCNGQETCIIDNNINQRPSFTVGKDANCAFVGQSINIEYSCVPEFKSNELPSIDICSSKNLDDIKEGFIYTPNYPNNYPNGLKCSKTISIPDSGFRLKIFTINFDVKSFNGLQRKSNDWLEINHGEKFYGKRQPFTLLYDDVIPASLMFQTNSTNIQQSSNRFLLYFIVTPIRRFRPLTTTTTTTTIETLQKVAPLSTNSQRKSNTGLILLVVLLSGLLFVSVCTLLLYKRRNDRRIRYINETFSSFMGKPSKRVRLEMSDHTAEMKLNSSTTNNEQKFDSKDIDIYSDRVDSLEKNHYVQKNNDISVRYENINDEKLNQFNNL